MFQNVLRERSKPAAPFQLFIYLGNTYFDKRELCHYEKTIRENDEENKNDISDYLCQHTVKYCA
jgi:hypothetical protein